MDPCCFRGIHVFSLVRQSTLLQFHFINEDVREKKPSPGCPCASLVHMFKTHFVCILQCCYPLFHEKTQHWVGGWVSGKGVWLPFPLKQSQGQRSGIFLLMRSQADTIMEALMYFLQEAEKSVLLVLLHLQGGWGKMTADHTGSRAISTWLPTSVLLWAWHQRSVSEHINGQTH